MKCCKKMAFILGSDIVQFPFRYILPFQDGGPFHDITTRQNHKTVVHQSNFIPLGTARSSFLIQCFRCSKGDGCVVWWREGRRTSPQAELVRTRSVQWMSPRSDKFNKSFSMIWFYIFYIRFLKLAFKPRMNLK